MSGFVQNTKTNFDPKEPAPRLLQTGKLKILAQ